MSDEILVSIVVPVYKVEKYLDKCVESILNQTYKNFELILVDDGSPDMCPQRCDEYAAKYDCIKTVHKKNGGLSDARNFGLKYVSGKYVTFIDSDDYVAADYLEVLVELHNKYNAEICVGGLCTFYEGEEPQTEKNIKECIFSGIEALEHMLYQDMLDTSACAMLLSIDIARNNLFPVGKYHEDEFTTYKYYSSTNRVAVTSKTLYFYLQRRGSIMHVFGQASLDELDAADNLVTVCEDNWPELVNAAKSKKFSDYCQVLLSNKSIRLDYPKVFNRIIGYLNKEKRGILLDSRARVKNRVAALLLFFDVKLLETVYIWVGKK